MSTKKTIPSLLDCALEEIAEKLDSGLFNSVQLVEAYLARIEEVDSEFKSVIETNPDALTIAAALDRDRKELGSRG
jgi:amidase